MTDVEYPVSDDSAWVGPARAVIGLAQGAALYFLFDAYQSKAWPATDGTTFAALCTAAIFVPLIVVSALTHLRLGQLICWALAVTLICAGLAWYDIYRDPISSPDLPRNLPSLQLWLALVLGLFIGHGLLIAGAGDRRFIARYPTYFGISWKHGLQAVMAALFTGIFWLVLWLGADLFKLIKIDFLYDLIRKNWFWIPATTVALNYAIHITDVRVGIVRGMRTLSCNLLSWLLPLLTLIAVSFVVALAFTGMEPLWNTRRASSILLTAAASLIFLINSAYQDGAGIDGGGGSEVRPLPRLLRIAVKTASLILIPLVLLAAYGIWLRVSQYGWTPQRLIATACAMVAACYALGYAVAAIIPSVSVFRLETTNVVTAFVILAVLLALYTPVADPARISVADQMRRLDAGTISPDKLDYMFLRFGAGRYGNDALRKLAEQPTSQPSAEKAAEALQKKTRYGAPLQRATAEDRTRNITVVRPQGQSLPSAFIDTDWSTFQRSYLLPSCLTTRARCDAILFDLDGDGAAEIILLPSPTGQAIVFRMGANRSWSYLGSLAGSHCPGMRDALLAGGFSAAQPAYKELEIIGHRLRLALPADCTANTSIPAPKR